MRGIGSGAAVLAATLGASAGLFALLAPGALPALADVVSGANVRVTFTGSISPKALPRSEPAPITLRMEGRLGTVAGTEPPQLRKVVFSINRNGKVSTEGLPLCAKRRLVATNSAQALANCGDALIGHGHFTADIVIPSQAPFPAHGKLLTFNARRNGRPVILAHVYGTDPAPTSQVMTFTYRRPGGGAYGTTMALQVPQFGGDWGHVTGFALRLHRIYSFEGRRRSVVTASCPAPAGFDKAFFRAAKGTYYLADGREITRLLTGTCRVSDP